jgi:hypothetical protein
VGSFWSLRGEACSELRRNLEPKPEAKAEPKPEAIPALVERVHELYEELGREDVRTVQDCDKKHQAEREARRDHSTK